MARGLTDREWVQGTADLEATLPDREMDEAMRERRGRVYRDALGHLTGEQWRYSVRQACARCKFFPTISHLLEFSSEPGAPHPTPVARPLLPGSTPIRPRPQTPGEVAEYRRSLREGIDQIKRALKERGMDIDRVGAKVPAQKRRSR